MNERSLAQSIPRTFIVAGHETIGNTVGWILYELSKHPALQTQLRSELESVQQEAANQGRQVLETSDYDSMTLLTATIKVYIYTSFLLINR